MTRDDVLIEARRLAENILMGKHHGDQSTYRSAMVVLSQGVLALLGEIESNELEARTEIQRLRGENVRQKLLVQYASEKFVADQLCIQTLTEQIAGSVDHLQIDALVDGRARDSVPCATHRGFFECVRCSRRVCSDCHVPMSRWQTAEIPMLTVAYRCHPCLAIEDGRA